MVKIFLDAGHGGKDLGAIGNGLHEKDVALDITLRIEQKLQAYQNVDIKLSRNKDKFLTLSERTDMANVWGADCFLSLHLNAVDDKNARGFESFIYNGPVSQATQALQNVLHEEIIKKIGAIISRDRGKKRANFHVLRESNMPAVLGENLFVSNANDANLLKSHLFLDTLAQGYVTGLEKFFGLELKSSPNNKTPVTEEELWQVIAGTYANRDNADEQVKRLLKDGYKAYVLKKQ